MSTSKFHTHTKEYWRNTAETMILIFFCTGFREVAVETGKNGSTLTGRHSQLRP